MRALVPSFTLALVASAVAQTELYLPASAAPASLELPAYSLRPFMQTNSRVQMFFSATEVGANAFTATALALRYDGPIPQVGAPGPFAIQRLQIRVGSTTVGLPDATFAANLSQPLTTVFDGPWSYLPDPGTASPSPWAEPNNALGFTFTTPAAVTIPVGGNFVVELVMEGNNIASFGFSHALVDGVRTTGGTTNGTSLPFGQGCSASAAASPATIGTTGTYAPGSAHFLNGQNLGANSPVFAVIGLENTNSQFGPLPFTLPGTNCQLYTSPDFYWLLFSDAGGSIAQNQQAAALALPALPAFAGLALYEQLVAFVPGANALDFISSDARVVTLGTLAPPTIGVYSVSHGGLHDATVADRVEPFGYAVRLTIQ